MTRPHAASYTPLAGQEGLPSQSIPSYERATDTVRSALRTEKPPGLASLILLATLAACSAREDPQLFITVSKDKDVTIEGRAGSDHTKIDMQMAIANAMADHGWAGESLLTVNTNVRIEPWQSRMREVFGAVQSFSHSRIGVAARSVEVTGEAPAVVVTAIRPTFEKIFGPAYRISVDVRPLPEAVHLAAPLGPRESTAASVRPAPGSRTLVYHWFVRLGGQGVHAPAIEIPTAAGSAFQVADGVSCHFGPMQLSYARENGVRVTRIRRTLSCDGATIRNLAWKGAFRPRSAGCEYRADLPLSAVAAMVCNHQFVVRREGEWINTLQVTTTAAMR